MVSQRLGSSDLRKGDAAMKQTRMVFLAISLVYSVAQYSQWLRKAKGTLMKSRRCRNCSPKCACCDWPCRRAADEHRHLSKSVGVDRVRVAHEDIRRLTRRTQQHARHAGKKRNQRFRSSLSDKNFWRVCIKAEVDMKRRTELEFEMRRAKESIELILKLRFEPLKERETAA
jgi:hypothetical protein